MSSDQRCHSQSLESMESSVCVMTWNEMLEDGETDLVLCFSFRVACFVFLLLLE